MNEPTAFARISLIVGLCWLPVQAHVAPVRQAAAPVSPLQPAAAAPAHDLARTRLEADYAAMRRYRPSYPFWRHVFTIPDGAIVVGSDRDGTLIATFPVKGDWAREARWEDASHAATLAGRTLPGDPSKRRDEAVRVLAGALGPVVHNPTRGHALLPNIRRYGPFLAEWGAIFERFGVPAEIGLAQAIVESGLSGTVRSEARAVGFCQWLLPNWNRLKTLSPHVIEGHNQTTQAGYCAAYLAILATKYGSFIPALSEHHTGGTNVGRTLINGERLGGGDVRERYFAGAAFARDLRVIAPRTFSDLYGTYGPRSFRYAEMVFGNTATVGELMATVPQAKVFAMRTARAVSLQEAARRAGLSPDDVRRFNPALRARVPANATLYLPRYVPSLGRDVSFWHRPASQAYASALDELLRIQRSPDEWDSPEFDAVLDRLRRRFAATATEEGSVMATTLGYVLQDRRSNRQAQILAEFRRSARMLELFELARSERASHLLATPNGSLSQ